jgi:hypothetical protein
LISSSLLQIMCKKMVPPFLGAEQELNVGTETVIESDAPDETRGVVFEDDGETGYFYARDYAVPERFFVDALHIYNVQGVVDRDKPCRVKIIWARDFSAAALMINLVPHAVFHFVERCGYAKRPYPAPDPSTGWRHSDELLKTREFFFPREGNAEQGGASNP